MRRPPADDLYARLGVPPTADTKEIQKAWRTKIQELHPDRRPGDLDANAEAARLNEAREILTNSRSRAEYDLHRRAQQRSYAGSRSGGTQEQRREPPPPPPPPPSPPPAPPRVVLEPSVVDFGTVRLGAMPGRQTVTVRLSDGSPLDRVAVLHHWGRFWTNEQYDEVRGCKAFTVIFEGRPVANLEPGEHDDMAEIAVGDQRLPIRLRIFVKAAPDREPPSQTVPPPRGPEPEPARASAGSAPVDEAPHRGGRTPRLTVLLLVLAVLTGVGAWATTHVLGRSPGKSTTSAASAQADSQAPSYCKIQYQNDTIAYYSVKPGTTNQPLNPGQPTWSVAGPNWNTHWVAWLTPGFPYWEEANLDDGYSPDGRTSYHRLTYVETAPFPGAPWQPQAEALQQYPHLDRAAEASMRKQFLGEWIKDLTSPTCR